MKFSWVCWPTEFPIEYCSLKFLQIQQIPLSTPTVAQRLAISPWRSELVLRQLRLIQQTYIPSPRHLTPTVTKACPFDLAFALDLSGHRKFTLDVYAGTDLSAEKFQTSGHKFHFLLGGHCEQSYFLLLFQSLGHWADTQVTLLTRRLHFCDYKWDHEDSERDGENSGLCCRCVLLKSGFCFCFFVFLQF